MLLKPNFIRVFTFAFVTAGLMTACDLSGLLSPTTKAKSAAELDPTLIAAPSPTPTPTATPVACVGGPTTFSTNMSARAVIGQADFVQNSSNRGGAVSANTLSDPLGVTVQAGKLYIADGSNNRILIYNSVPTTNGASADAVLGQADFVSSARATSATGLNGPQGIWANAQYLAVAEWSNSRVSLWPLSGSSISYVFGQADAITSGANSGGRSASSIANATSVVAAGGKYIVNDAGNHRLMLFNDNVSGSGASAVTIQGQSDAVSAVAGTGNNQMDFPLGAATDGTKLVVVDSNNNRLLIYNSIPTATGATADVVWGGFGASSLTLNYPVGAHFDGTRLFVADRGNDRVLVFNSLPTSASQPADAVLGQSTFNSGDHNQCNCTTAAANTLWGVHFVYWDGCRLVVSDKQNHRVLIY